MEHLVEQFGAQGRVWTTNATDIVELPSLVLALQALTLCSQHGMVGVATDDGQTVGHVHIVLFVEERVVMLLPDGVDLIEQFWRCGVRT